MAVQDCNEVSNIMAIKILAGDDDLAKQVAELSKIKNYAYTQRARLKEAGEKIDVATGKNANELELMGKSAEIKIDAIVQSRILQGDAGQEAYMELAKQINKTKGSLVGGVNLLEKVKNAPVLELDDIARLWDDTLDTSAAMKEMEDAISNFVASDYSIYRAYHVIEDTQNTISKKIKDAEKAIADAKKRVKSGDMTKKEFDKLKTEKDTAITTLRKERDEIDKALETSYRQAIDKIKKGGNPTGFAKLDKEWQVIKKTFGNDPKKAGKAWTNYIMAREIIAGGEMADEVLKVLKNEGQNLTGPLTQEWIAKCDNLDTLLARAFTNTEQLCMDGNLRAIYREKLTQLTSGVVKLNDKNVARVNSLINTSLFAEEGATLSDVMLNNRAFRSMKDMGYKVTEEDGGDILKAIEKLSKDLQDEGKKVLDDTIQIAGNDMRIEDIVQLIYDITGDKNILALMASKSFPSGTILDIATQKLLGNDAKAKKAIMALFKKGAEGEKIKNARNLYLKSTTGWDVPDGSKVGYFNYRDGLYVKDDLSSAKANLMDKIADKNRMRLADTDFTDLTTTEKYSKKAVEDLRSKIERATDGGFLIVNDARWADNPLLRDAINPLVKDNKLTIIYPKGGAASSFVAENGNLYFKTTNRELFDDISGTVSIQSMGQVRPTREMMASAVESRTGRNQDKLRYQATYGDEAVDNLGNALSDQQVEFFAKSAIRDENGNLIKVFRGRSDRTPAEVFGKNPQGGAASIYGDQTVLFFTTNEDMARVYGGGRKATGKRITTLEEAREEIDERAMNGEIFEVNKVGDDEYVITAKMDYAEGVKEGDEVFRGNMKQLDRFLIDEDNVVTMLPEPRTYECYLNITNPLIVDAKGANRNDITFNGGKMDTNAISIWAKDNGYDGVIIRNVVERNGVGKIDDYIAFDQSQVKGVDNTLPTNDTNWRFSLKDDVDYSNATYTKGGQTLDGNKLSDQQLEHFEGAKSWEDGELKDGVVELYHGTANGRFDTFDAEKASPEGDWGAGFYSTNSANDVSRNYEGGGPDLENKISRRAEQIQYERHTDYNEYISYDEAKKLAREELEGESAKLSVYVKMTNPAVVGHTYLFDDIVDDDELWDVLDLVRQKYDISDAEGEIMNIIYEAVGDGGIEIGEFKRRLGERILDSVTDDEGNLITNDIARLIIQGQGYDGIIDPTVAKKFKGMNLDEGTVHYIAFDENQYKFTDNLIPTDNINMRMRMQSDAYADELDITADAAKKVELFRHSMLAEGVKTMEDLANKYGLGIGWLKDIDLPKGVEAWGAYGNQMIYLAEMVKEGTLPHEIFHGAFRSRNPEGKADFIKEGIKLFGIKGEVRQGIEFTAEDVFEEMLAEEFGHWARTGEFTRQFRELIGRTATDDKAKKYWGDKVKKIFKDFMEWLGLTRKYGEEVRGLFNDIINCKYLPEDGKPINAAEALVEYNDGLNEAAVNYFGKILGYSTDVIDDEYVKSVQTKLSDMLGMDINTFDQFPDKAELYMKIDKQLSLERMTSGRFDKEMVDIQKIRDGIRNMSDEDLAKDINDTFGNLVKGGTIAGNENIALIREAWYNYNIAQDMPHLLEAEGKIISLVRGIEPPKLDMAQLQNVVRNETDAATLYKDMFFPDQKVSDEDLALFIRQINGDIFDGLSIQFTENLVKAGYDLPLVNTKQVVYDYLAGKLDLNSDFCQAFFYKNDIPMTRDNLNAIMDTMMPKEFKFDFETFEGKLADDSIVGTISRVTKRDNMFLPDTYSALAAMEDAGKGLILGNKEYDVLKSTIDKYVDAMKKGLRDKDFKFLDAQKLKQDFSYAMDTFEQDIIMPRYGKFFTPQERQGILGVKYTAPIGVGGQKDIGAVEEMLDNWRNRILGRDEKLDDGGIVHHEGAYKSIMKNVAQENDVNAAIAKGYDEKAVSDSFKERVENRRNQLIERGATIKEINGEYVVYDVKETLWETINNLPSNIQGVAGLYALGKQGIDELTNRQAYIMLRYLEAAKALSTTSNYATQLMYKQMPQLAQYSFFENYAIDAMTGLPKVMSTNALMSDTFFKTLDEVSNAIDGDIKRDIFGAVKKGFKKDKYLLPHSKGGMVGLDKIVDNAIARQMDELGRLDVFSPAEKRIARAKMKNIYTNMFIPYTYLRDIPNGGTLKNGQTLFNVKKKVEDTIKQSYEQALKDLDAAGATDGDAIQQMITIKLDDGTSYSLGDLGKRSIDDWKRVIFGDENITIKSADDVDVELTADESFLRGQDTKDRKLKRKEELIRKNIDNQYLATLKTIQNEGQVITNAERDMMVSFMHDVRTDLRKYSLTNKMVDAIDSVSGMGEEVARGLKGYVIGLGGMRSFGKWFHRGIWERYALVRDAYKGYYNMSMEQLGKVRLDTLTPAERVAWDTARYFKNLERQLGSADGIKGVTTSNEINKAFYHIGEVFMNLGREGAGETGGIRGLFGMLSGIEQNQVLKFFKFANPNQASYVKQFIVKTDRMKGLDWTGGYRDYVNDVSGIDRATFNQIFGTEFGDKQFKRVLQGLTGFTLAGGGFARVFNRILDATNQSRMAFRMLMSYPGQLLTIPQQGVSYFLKQIGYEKALGIEDMARIDDIRESFGVLDGAYNELSIKNILTFNPDSLDKSAFYNRYGIPGKKDLYWNTGISTADDYITMYAKVDKKYSKPGWIQQAVKWFDPYKDNANNFIDGIFARNFKNISFIKGLKDNSVMKFSSAEDFLDFMNDATVSAELKSKLMDAVAASSSRNFRNILGLGFGGLDRPVAGRGWANCLYGLMQMFNFRGSWGQNIFKQTGDNIYKMFRFGSGMINPRLSREAKEELIQYMGNSPEFVNFVTAMAQDLKWAWKLQRYQDNGRWPDPDRDGRHYFMDYLSYMRETMNMVSQRYQGIQSFGPMRPISEMGSSFLQSQMDPTVYQDTWGVGAFFNALGKNFGRQWKPVNWLVEMAGAAEAGGWSNVEAYIDKQFFNLSFGSLRYMVNEDENAYGYTYEVTGQYGGIPGIVMGEAQVGSDKSFLYDLDNTETWKTMQMIADDDVAWDDKKSYLKNLWKGIVNGSQLFKTIKNFNTVRKGDYTKVFYDREDLADIIQTTDAGKEFYEKGYIIPKTPKDADTFMKTILANGQYRPGSSSFYKSILQFEDFGHMDGKNGKAADADMELWLEHMKYKTDEHGQFVKKNGERVVENGWKDLITNIKEYGYDKDYTTKVIYNYSKSWLDIHNSDPNYRLYLSMLGQGRAAMLIDEEMNKRKEQQNKGKKGKENKWDDSENEAANLRDTYLKIGNSKREGSDVTFFEELNMLDEDDATLVALKVIRDQATELGKKDIEKFFDVKTDEKDGEVVESVTLKPQYESVLKQIGHIGRAIDEGNVDRVIAATSLLTHQFKNADPLGDVTATAINSIYDRVYNAKNLSPSLKNEIMIGVFYDNIDMVQRNPDKLREKMGDAYDKYAKGMNEMLHKWDSQIISNIDSIIASGEDKNGSKAKRGRAASKRIKSYMNKLGGSSGDGVGTTYRRGQRAGMGSGKRVPVVIKGADLVKQLGLKGYAPTNVNEVVLKHTPTVDFSIQKDINRKIKTKGTQTVSNKKQLSNIETKTTKAIEAES